jgi:ribonuclease-3
VRREALAQAAKKLSVGTWLVMGRGEAASGGAERVSNLANAFEAVAGAVYLDKGFHAARDFIVRALDEHITALAKSAGAPKDPKSVLQEVLQGRGAKSPEYTLVSMMGPDHDRTFVVEVLVDGHVAGRGEGRRKIDAERAAALDAVSRLDTSGQD